MVHFNGINYSGALLALAALRSGVSVSFQNLHTLSTAYEPELTELYPRSALKAPKAKAQLNFMMNCSSLFPHLYYPQRVLVLGKDMNTATISGIDKLFGRDRETASLPLSLSRYPVYEGLSQHFKNGWLIYEYLFDRNRAIFELVKRCIAEGAQLQSNPDKLALKINCLPFHRKKRFFDSSGASSPFPNSIRLVTPSCSIAVLRYAGGVSVQNTCKEVLTSAAEKEMAQQLLQQIQIDRREELQRFLLKTDETKTPASTADFTLEDASLSELKMSLNQTTKYITRKGKLKVDLDKLFANGTSITAEEFRNIQNECNEKFDLAKQTGIEYNWFLHLFYRYRVEMDDLIEEAYQMMHKERDAKVIWKEVIAKHIRLEQTKLL